MMIQAMVYNPHPDGSIFSHICPIHRLSLTSSSAAVSVTGGDLEPSGRCCATSLERKDSLWETGSLCLEWLNVPGLCCVLMQAE